MALNNVDLPTFGRPTTATNGFATLSPLLLSIYITSFYHIKGNVRKKANQGKP